MTQLSLSPNTFGCLVDQQLVILDLATDQYFSMDRHKTRLFHQLLSAKDLAPLSQDCQVLAQELQEQGVLKKVPTGESTKRLTGQHPAPDYDLVGFDIGLKPGIQGKHLFRFLRAAWFGYAALKWRPIEKVIARIKRNQSRLSKEPAPEYQLRTLVEVFNRLRPLLFTAHNQCLYDALVLAHFLMQHRIRPTLVFGVHLGPFGAHCWVEHDNFVLNDTVALTRLQTPIMVV
ncbi:lasso peptide biosynthesis B2 protein [Porticoccus sp. GXU_MW_L64]